MSDHNIYHLCLQDLNWDDLAQKKVPAPFVPRISNELDVSNFSEEFTQLVPQDSPAIVPPDVDKIFKVSYEMNVILSEIKSTSLVNAFSNINTVQNVLTYLCCN